MSNHDDDPAREFNTACNLAIELSARVMREEELSEDEKLYIVEAITGWSLTPPLCRDAVMHAVEALWSQAASDVFEDAIRDHQNAESTATRH